MSNDVVLHPVIEAGAEQRSEFLRAVALWTFGGLSITAVVSLLSAMFIAPAVLRNWVASLLVIYGSMILSQTLARRMVYGTSKVGGFVLGTAAQGVALGFLLFIAAFGAGDTGQGFQIIGYALAMTVLSTLAMLVYVTNEKHEFSMLRAGLSMVFLPMLLLMGLQLVFPIGGTLGVVIAVVFVAVSVGSMLYKLNFVVHSMSTNMAMEGGYELTLGIVVLFWNVLSLLLRLRRR